MKLRKISILLLMIVLLPVVFYTAFEFNSMNETEQMINEIYMQQVNVLLFSVNQYAWDITRSWTSKLEALLYNKDNITQERVMQFLNDNNVIEASFIADTSLTKVMFITTQPRPVTLNIENEDILDTLKNKRSEVDKIIHRYRVGYKKLETINFTGKSNNDSKIISLMGVVETADKELLIVGMVINSERFINSVLAPKINETEGSDFNIAIYKTGSAEPVYSTGDIDINNIIQRKKIWIFPDHYLGINLKGTSLEKLAQNRLYRSLILIFVLDFLLILGVLIIYKNIKAEMNLARMKSDFVSNVSHELRTPLALIRMFAETMELGRVNSEEKKKEYYKIIGYESQRLTHLINNILDFSKMEAGKKQYNFQNIDLNNLVNSIMEVYKFHLKSKGFSLDLKLSPSSLKVNADEGALSEVFINLLDNAVKYSDKIKEISIKTGSHDGEVFFSIADKGIGVSAHVKDKIFQKFYRAESHMTHNTKGSGLGLSLVKQVVEAHRGKITVYSKPGEGSEFMLLLPQFKEEQ